MPPREIASIYEGCGGVAVVADILFFCRSNSSALASFLKLIVGSAKIH
jgi:hypothetical protein